MVEALATVVRLHARGRLLVRHESDDIDLYLQDKLTGIVGEGSTSPQGSPLATPGGTPTGSAPVDGEAATPTYDQAAFDALEQEELDVAQADFACEEEKIAPVEDEVQAEMTERSASRTAN